VCNLYSITPNQAAIIALFRVVNRYVGNLERLSVALLRNEMPLPKPVRLLGISLSSLQRDEQTEPQLDLPI
jgi:hypothetical protein